MTQITPSADVFSQGTPKFDTARLFEYVRAAPSATDPSYALGGTGFSINTWSQASRIYSGWFGQGVGGSPLEAGQSAQPAVSTANVALGTRIPTLWIPREHVFLEADVEVSFQEQSTNSAQLHSAAGARRAICGVAARVAGATLTNPGAANTYHAGGDGYFFGWCFDNGLAVGGGKYVLWRVNAGVCTRLADDPTGATTSTTWLESQPWRPRVVRMTVHDDGATVVLRCYRRRGGFGSIGDDDLLFEYVDSSGSRLTAQGRVGFFVSNEQSQAAVWTAPCVNYFQARAYGVTPYKHRDEWTRYNLRACAAFAPSSTAFVGYDLASGWFGDSLSGSAAGSLLEDDGNSRASVVAGAAGTFTRQYPADDPVTQDRQLLVRFASAGTPDGTRAAGPALRVSHAQAVGLAASSSYSFVLEYDDDASTARFALYRTVTSARLLLAELATTYDLDDNRQLALSVEANSGGAAVLLAYEEGIQLALEEPASPVSGVSVDAAGTVIDASSARVQSGAAQGFYASVSASSTQALYVDAFDAAGLVAGELLEEDMASVGFPAEGAGETGTLEIPLGWPIEEVCHVPALRHELDLGHRYTALADDTEARGWVVSIPSWSDAERLAFRTFLAEHEGPGVPFAWTPPGELEAATVRFTRVDVDFRLELVGANAWVGSFELERLVPA